MSFTRKFRPEHRGTVLIVVIVLIAVASTVFGVQARSTISQYRQAKVRGFQIQAVRMAQAGQMRLQTRIIENDDFAGEVWNIPAADLDGVDAGRVTIQKGRESTFSILAEFPADGTFRVRRSVVVSVERPQAESPKDAPISSPATDEETP